MENWFSLANKGWLLERKMDLMNYATAFAKADNGSQTKFTRAAESGAKIYLLD